MLHWVTDNGLCTLCEWSLWRLSKISKTYQHGVSLGDYFTLNQAVVVEFCYYINIIRSLR